METKSSQSPVLNVPVAIIIAGALIAGSLYLSGINAGNTSSSNNSDTKVAAETTQPTAKPAAAGTSIGDIREVSKDDNIRGADNAKVTIIEYSDVQCSFCKRFHPTLTQLIEEYPNDVRWVYRHFVLGRFPGSDKIAAATECAGEQGKFWEATDIVMEATTQIDVDKLSDIAKEAGVPNISQFESCVESDKYADKVTKDTEDARVAGGRGTPYSVVIGPDGEKLPLSGAQPYSAVKQMVDKLLES